MTLRVTWPQALAWRLSRQLVEPVGSVATEEVVRRLCAVQAQVASSAELAVRIRQQVSAPGDVARALAEGRLIRTWAMRGTLHLLTPEDAGSFLSLLAAGKTWERPSWQRYFGVSPKQIEGLRQVVREALDGRVLTREELVAEVVAHPELDHIGDALRSGWGTLLKPIAWQGDLCFGPSQGSRVTFMRPDAASPSWAGVPPADEAGPRAIAAYLSAYGPATEDSFHSWLSRGWAGKRQLRAWFEALADRLVDVEVDGEHAHVLAEDVDGLAAAAPGRTVRMLPGFDAWVLGPGTEDPHVIPSGRRTAVSRQAGWIAPIVLVGGVVRGTWTLDGDVARIEWFGEAGTPPTEGIEEEIVRLGGILGRELRVETALV